MEGMEALDTSTNDEKGWTGHVSVSKEVVWNEGVVMGMAGMITSWNEGKGDGEESKWWNGNVDSSKTTFLVIWIQPENGCKHK